MKISIYKHNSDSRVVQLLSSCNERARIDIMHKYCKIADVVCGDICILLKAFGLTSMHRSVSKANMG